MPNDCSIADRIEAPAATLTILSVRGFASKLNRIALSDHHWVVLIIEKIKSPVPFLLPGPVNVPEACTTGICTTWSSMISGTLMPFSMSVSCP